MVFSLFAVAVLGIIAWLGTLAGLQYLFAVVLPLTAVCVFLVGFMWRIVDWAKSPVPFSIPTTAGQQQSLPWIKPACLDNPSDTKGVFLRMILEVLTFRSLFRNTAVSIEPNGRVAYWSSKFLWLFALLFHYSFLVIFIRHFRFFLEPIPFFITALDAVDGIFQIGAPRLYLTDVVIVLALLFLFGRRLVNARTRYISLVNDYFPLFLLLGVAGSGICMRYFDKTDIAAVKTFTMGLVSLRPDVAILANVNAMFFVHLFLVSVLLIYFPFSKLMHMGGVFLSPTRNMPNNARAVRHINPWNPAKEYRTYAEYEDDFREAMVEAGIPVEKQPASPTE